MKITFFLIIFILISPLHASVLLPYGKWRYSIYSNNIIVGNTTISRSRKHDIITTDSTLNLKTDTLMIIGTESIKETLAYKPYSISSKSTFVTKDKINRSYINATIADNIITVSGLNAHLKLKLNHDVIFGTNKIIFDSVNSNFENNGSEYLVYDPSSNAKKTYKMKIKTIRNVTIQINDYDQTVNQLVIYWRVDKDSPISVMEIYCDNFGTIYMYKITLDNIPLLFKLQK